MPQKRSGNQAVFLLIILAVAAVFAVQIPLPEEMVQAEIPHSGDVAVIGGTTAAILSALKAAQEGASVFLFPDGQELAEDSLFLLNGGLALADSFVQQQWGVEFDSALFGEKLRETGGGLNDPALLRAFLEAQLNFHGRLKETWGLSFDSLADPERHPYLHLCARPEAFLLFKQNLLTALRNSAVILRKERVKELLFSPQGHLEALLLEKEEKTEENSGELIFYFRSAIIADGGYNENFLREHNIFPSGNILFNLRADQEIKGLKMAKEQGLDLIQPGFQNRRLLLYNPGREEYLFFPEELLEGSYLINTEGKILPGKEISLGEAVNFVISSPPGGAFVLAPQQGALSFPAFFRSFENWEELSREYNLRRPSLFPDIGRLSFPLYAAPLRAGVDYMLGGLAVTPRGEVKKQGRAVKGLYAAGEAAGGLHGEAMLPGMALSETLFLAEIAGEGAARYARH